MVREGETGDSSWWAVARVCEGRSNCDTGAEKGRGRWWMASWPTTAVEGLACEL